MTQTGFAIQAASVDAYPVTAIRRSVTPQLSLAPARLFLLDPSRGGQRLGGSALVQVYGGHGFIREWGMEQIVRDARIAMLYEGTTGILALDLVGRKVLGSGGQLLLTFTQIVDEYRSADSDKLRTAGLKVLLDGSIQGFTAKMGWPGYYTGTDHGVWMTPPDQVIDICRRA